MTGVQTCALPIFPHLPSGKSVFLSVGTKYAGGHEYLVLKVGDEGIGISSKEQDKIFVRFYNNKNSKPGLSNGIGLSLTSCSIHPTDNTP